MKNASVKLVLAATILVSTSSAFALNVGTWTLNNGLPDGVWTEFWDGGGPGLPGNRLHATDSVWQLRNFILDAPGAVADPSNPGGYITHYSGGELVLLDGIPPYDGAPNSSIVISGLHGINYSILNQNTLSFTFSATGVYNTQPVSFTAVYSGDPLEIYDSSNKIVKQTSRGTGVGFSALTLTVGPAASVPDGGITIAMLGLAMCGLFGIRRSQ